MNRQSLSASEDDDNSDSDNDGDNDGGNDGGNDGDNDGDECVVVEQPRINTIFTLDSLNSKDKLAGDVFSEVAKMVTKLQVDSMTGNKDEELIKVVALYDEARECLKKIWDSYEIGAELKKSVKLCEDKNLEGESYDIQLEAAGEKFKADFNLRQHHKLNSSFIVKVSRSLQF